MDILEMLSGLISTDPNSIEDVDMPEFLRDAFQFVSSWLATLFNSDSWANTWETIYLRVVEWFSWVPLTT